MRLLTRLVAQLIALTANVNRDPKKNPQGFSADDFLPKEPTDDDDPEEMDAEALAAAEAVDRATMASIGARAAVRLVPGHGAAVPSDVFAAFGASPDNDADEE